MNYFLTCQRHKAEAFNDFSTRNRLRVGERSELPPKNVVQFAKKALTYIDACEQYKLRLSVRQ